MECVMEKVGVVSRFYLLGSPAGPMHWTLSHSLGTRNGPLCVAVVVSEINAVQQEDRPDGGVVVGRESVQES